MIEIKRTLFLSSLFPITVFLPFKFNRDPIVFKKREDSEERCTERGKSFNRGGSRSTESIKIKRVMSNQNPLDKWQINVIRKTIRQLSLSRFETRPCFAVSATLKDASR